MHPQDALTPAGDPQYWWAANFWVYCTMVLSLVTVGLVIAAFLVT